MIVKQIIKKKKNSKNMQLQHRITTSVVQS